MHRDLPGEIHVYVIGSRQLWVEIGARNCAISEDNMTPEELIGIVTNIAARQPKPSKPQVEMAFV